MYSIYGSAFPLVGVILMLLCLAIFAVIPIVWSLKALLEKTVDFMESPPSVARVVGFCLLVACITGLIIAIQLS
jgi:hypothetical protein